MTNRVSLGMLRVRIAKTRLKLFFAFRTLRRRNVLNTIINVRLYDL